MNRTFSREWSEKVRRVRKSDFWREVSSPPTATVRRSSEGPRRGEIAIDGRWTVILKGDVQPDGPARAAIEDFRRMASGNFGINFQYGGVPGSRQIVFELVHPGSRPPLRWDRSFTLEVGPDIVRIRARSEGALLRAGLYLSNYWRLRRNTIILSGRRTVRPAIPIHIGADLWGGFSTTQAWIDGREDDTNFIELARMGVNCVPVMALLEDYIEDAPGPFRSLINRRATVNRRRLARLVDAAARHDIFVLLMGYNPKIAPDHPVFRSRPQARGAMQFGDVFRVLCSSDAVTRRFVADAWASLFEEMPRLGGILAITGGEGFYHCFMHSEGASDCPRCSRRSASDVVAELTNGVAAAIREKSPGALMVSWLYSAYTWSHDRDQVQLVGGLDPEHVMLQTEIEKDSVDWRKSGYAKNVWDYSISCVSVSDRCRRQRSLARNRRLPFSCKIECNNSIECLNVPYLPALENQAKIWENCLAMRPQAVHSRWLFDGSCKSPSEELGFWLVWGRGTEFNRSGRVLNAIARRDFGDGAAPLVRAAWRDFSEALRHHPSLAYYMGSYYIGPGQPLVLDKDALGDLDPAFFGRFYWRWESTSTQDASSFVNSRPLFFTDPSFGAYVRRGPNRGRDIGLLEIRRVADIWERGARKLAAAGNHVPAECRPRYHREFILGQHLAYTWRSAANVEEFLRLRNEIKEFSGVPAISAGYIRENKRDFARMVRIAQEELRIARDDLKLVKGVDYLNQSLRLDMGTASQEVILAAKIGQVERLLAAELPKFEQKFMVGIPQR